MLKLEFASIPRSALLGLIAIFVLGCGSTDGSPNAGEGPECQADEACVDGSCVEGRCEPFECTDDEDCPNGSCVENACVAHECLSDEDCEDGSCEENSCVPYECTDDRDCTGGTCVENVCVEYECTTNRDCPDGRCVKNACVPYECTDDEHCPDGSCVGNVCVSHECEEDDDCVDGSCVENVCEPFACTDDDHCPNGSCVDGLCVPHECVKDDDCVDGTCVENVCEPFACTDDDHCPNGSCVENVCVPHECVVDGDCEGGSCVENVCVPHECVVDGDCEGGSCEANVCVPYECVEDKDCGDGVCVENACHEPIVCTLGAEVTTIQEAFDDRRCATLSIPAGVFKEHGIDAHRAMPIVGAGSDQSTLDADELGRHFQVPDGVELRLEGLTLIGGRAVSAEEGTKGGSILAGEGASIALVDMAFLDNRAAEEGGAIHVADGALNCVECFFLANEVTHDSLSLRGGVIFVGAGSAHLEDCTFEGNRALSRGPGDAMGGALYANAPLAIERCAFVENAVMVAAPTSTGGRSGGAIYATGHDVVMEDVRFEGNEASYVGCESCRAEGGALFQQGGTLQIDGFSATGSQLLSPPDSGIVRGGAFSLYDMRTIQLKNGSFEENRIRGGSSRSGGAVYIHFARDGQTAVQTFEGVNFLGNQIACEDEACPPTSGGHGGAIDYSIVRGTGELVLDRVLGAGTVISTPNKGSTYGAFAHLSAGAWGAVRARIQNSTLSDNLSSGNGDALSITTSALAANEEYGEVEVKVFNSTFVAGSGSNLFRLHYHSVSPTVMSSIEMRNSIIVQPESAPCSGNGELRSLGWLVHPGGLACNFVAGPGDVVDADPDLLALSDNGGGTLTHAIPEESPLSGVGEAGGCTDGAAAILVDQRGAQRTTPNCTPGAFSR